MASKLKCQACGIEFTGRYRKYCSEECRYSAINESTTCQCCGKVIFGGISKFYCSGKCKSRAWRERCEAGNTKISIKINCQLCGKERIANNKHTKFCSAECRIENKAIDRHIGRLEVNPIKTKYCLFCNKKFQTNKPSKLYCTVKCCFKYHKKEEHEKQMMVRRYIVKVRTCVICSKEFHTNNEPQLCCSPECSKIRLNERKRARRRRQKAYSIIGRRFKCKWCSEYSIAISSTQKFCCPEHSKKWHTKYGGKDIYHKIQTYNRIQLMRPFLMQELGNQLASFDPKQRYSSQSDTA